jgi:hypothetical protein
MSQDIEQELEYNLFNLIEGDMPDIIRQEIQ